MCVRTHLQRSLSCAVAVVFLALVVTAGGGSASGTTTISGVGIIRWGGSSLSTLTNVSKYSVVLSDIGNMDQAATLPGKSLVYGCGDNMYYGQAYRCSLNWNDVVSNNWVLKDASGNYVTYGNCGSGQYVLDIGDPGYQQAFVNGWLQILAAHPGNEGIWIDDMHGSRIYWCNNSAKYPSDAAWRSAVLSFLKAVSNGLRSHGYYVATNSAMYDPDQATYGDQNTGDQTLWWFGQVAPYVDGVNAEDWQYASGRVRINGSEWYQHWDGWQRLIAKAQSLNKDFLVQDGNGMPCTETVSAYLRASFLLEWDGGNSAFVYGAGNYTSGDPWTCGSSWTMEVGAPQTAKTQLASGVWKRVFANVTVYVNPTSATQIADGHTLASGTAVFVQSAAPTVSSTTTTTTTTATATTSPAPATTSTTVSTTTTATPASTTTATTTPTTTTTPATTTTGTTTSTTTTTTSTTTTTTLSPPTNLKLPAVIGPSLVGKSSKASDGTWTNNPSSFLYRWFRCSPAGTNCQMISGASGPTYVMTPEDDGATLVVAVIASNGAGTSSATSSPTATVKSTAASK